MKYVLKILNYRKWKLYKIKISYLLRFMKNILKVSLVIFELIWKGR